MKIDLKAFGKWFVREAIPTALMMYDVEPDAREFARANNLPVDASVALAVQIKENLINSVQR